jgi:predicted nucleic acid-binding protein
VNGWLLDTNVISELTRLHGTVRVLDWAAGQDEDRLFLSILTLGEYEKGLHHALPDNPLRLQIAAGIAALEARFAGRILPLTDSIARRWGVISGETKRLTGHTPPVIDTMLAAMAIEHDLCLVTRNLRDVRHSGASLLNPWDSEPGRRKRR